MITDVKIKIIELRWCPRCGERLIEVKKQNLYHVDLNVVEYLLCRRCGFRVNIDNEAKEMRQKNDKVQGFGDQGRTAEL